MAFTNWSTLAAEIVQGLAIKASTMNKIIDNMRAPFQAHTTITHVDLSNGGLTPYVNVWTSIDVSGVPNAAPGRILVANVFVHTRSEERRSVKLRQAAGFAEMECFNQSTDEVDSIYATIWVPIHTNNTIQWIVSDDDATTVIIRSSGVFIQGA